MWRAQPKAPMFFRREKEAVLTFADRLAHLRSAGLQMETLAGGRARVRRDALGVDVVEAAVGQARIAESGIVIGDELAELTDLGYQKIFLTPSGKVVPAVAEHLHALHDLQEDVREALGLTSLYNEGLGTTNEKHLYDRVEDRDAGVPRRPWQR
jgi:hypothetical protein